MKKKLFVLFPTLLVAIAATAHAAVDAEITTAVTDTTTIFGDYKTYALGVVVFSIILSVVKKFRRA
jgi:hypothetical protein